MSNHESPTMEPLIDKKTEKDVKIPTTATSLQIYNFLEAKTKNGSIYEGFTIFLILINVIAFCVGTLFVAEYNVPPINCSNTCDALFFGNNSDNGLDGTSVLEIITVFVFTLDYIFRFYVAGEKEKKFRGFSGRIRFICTFFSIVDLVSIVPFYIDFAIPGNLPASQFLRMFRLLRMMKVEGRYIEAFTLIDDVIREQKGVLGTALFVGASTWVICSSFYYVAERRSKDAIYCGSISKDVKESIPNNCDLDNINLELCTFNEWGLVNCTNGGCSGTIDVPHPCWNVYQSIPGAAFFTLLNLFGEFPLIDQHSTAGKFVGTIVAVVAVAVFAIPAGILGNGFEDLLARRREQKELRLRKDIAKKRLERVAHAMHAVTTAGWNDIGSQKQEYKSIDTELSTANAMNEEKQQEQGEQQTSIVRGDTNTYIGRMYNFLYAQTSNGLIFEYIIMFLIFSTTITFMLETTSYFENNNNIILYIEIYELVAVVIFTIEYTCRVIATVTIDPKYSKRGVIHGTLFHCFSFFALIDLLSILPYWIDFISTIANSKSPFQSTSTSSTFIRCLRLLRVLKAEKYTNAFTVFDDVILANSEVLIVTGFSAVVMWILFSALMYFAERDNLDPSMSMYYNTVPNAMWMTLLNLSGEAPLCHYTGLGKILVGIIGIFATGFFGIPIGLLGAGFEEWIDNNENDTPDYDGKKENVNGLLPDSPLMNGIIGSHLSSGLSVDEDGLQLSTHHSNALGTLTLRRDDHRRNSTKKKNESFMEVMGRFLDPSSNVDDNRKKDNHPSSSWFSCLEIAFDFTIFSLIFMTVFLGCIETIQSLNCGASNDSSSNNTTVCDIFATLEWIAVIVFTIEYIARVIFAPYAPDILTKQRQTIDNVASDVSSYSTCTPRLQFIFSFYSIIDLLAILPFYVAQAIPGGWVDQHDEYFRMLRLFRLLKLDKYIPSISLIDDVFRLKKNALMVTGFVSGALWVLFSGLQYLTEYQDTSNALDPLPDYGCNYNCTMATRFSSVVSALTYTCVHLTGDYPIVTYSFWGRVVCFFMVLIAVGVVSIPSGLIASGFAQVVQSKAKLRQRKLKSQDPSYEDIKEKERRDRLHSSQIGDGYFERKYAELDGQEVPTCTCCNTEIKRDSSIDRIQLQIHLFLNGEQILMNANTKEVLTKRTIPSQIFNKLILFLIITNVIAVIIETIPQVDQYVGNDNGNFFDIFEFISVTIFAIEYILRLISVIKDREHLYSIFFYATTFFGIIDLIAFLPYFIEQLLIKINIIAPGGDAATIFRLFRIFRILQLEHFVVAFTVLDNVFRASKDVLKATGLMALIIWIGCGALFYIAEQNNPNWRHCAENIPLTTPSHDGCYDFTSTAACNEKYPNQCKQIGFINMPDSLYYTAVFLGGEWGKIDFTVLGRLTCIFLCIAGIAIYAIPIGVLFDSFGAVLGMGCDDDDDDDEEEEEE
jgi:hypothetical protein